MIRKQKFAYNLLGFLKFFLFIPFIIGIFINWDAFTILLTSQEYNQGLLKVNSLQDGPAAESQQSTVSVSGYVDSTYTSLLIGDTETAYTDSIVYRYSVNEKVEIPIWFKSSGELSIKRYSHEQKFPIGRMSKKLVMYFLVFNVPLIVVWLLQRKLKIKYNLMNSSQPL